MPSLSIIIASYNTQELTRQCLTSIFKALPPKNGLEVIVVDNASADDSSAMIKREFPQVKLITNKTNRGFAAANNQGVLLSTGKYLLFLNSDTKISRFSLVKPLKYLTLNNQIGALTVKLLLPDGSLDRDNHRGFPTPWTALTHLLALDRIFSTSPLFNRYYLSYKNYSKIHFIPVAAGSYLLISRRLFDAINGWDESYFFYGEDIDLCQKINDAGKKIVYYPKVEVIHYKGASSGLRKESKTLVRSPKANRLKVARASTQAMKIFYQKYYQNRYPKPITTAVLLAIQLLGWLRLLKHRLH